MGTGERQRPAPSWVAPIFAVLGIATVPWTIYLSMTLPSDSRADYYRIAWVGFDIMLAAVLLATAYAAWRGRPRVGQFATAAATMLVVDAWFDITTSDAGLAEAILLAALVELPLAAVCLWIAFHVERVVKARILYLAKRAERLLREEQEHHDEHAKSRLEHVVREQMRLRTQVPQPVDFAQPVEIPQPADFAQPADLPQAVEIPQPVEQEVR